MNGKTEPDYERALHQIFNTWWEIEGHKADDCLDSLESLADADLSEAGWPTDLASLEQRLEQCVQEDYSWAEASIRRAAHVKKSVACLRDLMELSPPSSESRRVSEAAISISITMMYVVMAAHLEIDALNIAEGKKVRLSRLRGQMESSLASMKRNIQAARLMGKMKRRNQNLSLTDLRKRAAKELGISWTTLRDNAVRPHK